MSVTINKYTFDWGAGSSFSLIPDRGSITAADYYGYNTINPSSASSAYQEVDKAVIYLYEDLSTGKLSLHLVLDEHLSGKSGGRFTVTIRNLPSSCTIAAADEVSEVVKTDATTIVGTFAWGDRTDGLAIDNIEGFTTPIEIEVSLYQLIDEWKLASAGGETQYIPIAESVLTLTRTEETFDSLVVATPPPSAYDGTSMLVSLAAAPAVESIVYSTEKKPTIAKNLVYDEFGNPFISVVEDNHGRVVFDGGFPKFYNTNYNTAWTTFAEMSDSFKYMYNCMNWIANPDKVAAGNKNVLVWSDANPDESYSAKNAAASSGFGESIPACGQVAGFNIVTKSREDFGTTSPVDIPFSELDQYCAVIVMSTRSTSSSHLTAQSVANFVAYREAGNGLMIITDHDIFQGTANALGTNFGVTFFGTVNRSPIPVSDIIANYGNHPLWNNMTGSIHAGGSEGNVQTTTYPEYTGGTIEITGEGYKNLRILAKTTDGEVSFYDLSYALNIADPFSVVSAPPASTSLNEAPPVDFSIGQMNGQDVQGIVKLNNHVIGDFQNIGGTFSASSIPTLSLQKGVNDIVLEVTSPLSYFRNFTVARNAYDLPEIVSLARLYSTVQEDELQSVVSFTRAAEKSERLLAGLGSTAGRVAARNAKILVDYFKR